MGLMGFRSVHMILELFKIRIFISDSKIFTEIYLQTQSNNNNNKTIGRNYALFINVYQKFQEKKYENFCQTI